MLTRSKSTDTAENLAAVEQLLISQHYDFKLQSVKGTSSSVLTLRRDYYHNTASAAASTRL